MRCLVLQTRLRIPSTTLPTASGCKFKLRGDTITYATHRRHKGWMSDSSFVARSLDTNRDRSVPRNDTIGPFQLGISPSSLNRGEKVKKWSELSAGGKILRGTARTTNLSIILLGAGLSVLLVYSLTTELFSKNSPTVIYGVACERLIASPHLAKYLTGPLTFHNNPPSALRPRHRNRHVTSQIVLDSTGREHMIMTFYVQGSVEGAKADVGVSRLQLLTDWAKEKITALPEVTFEGAVQWMKETSLKVQEQARRVFRYLSGVPVPPSPSPSFVTREKTDTPKADTGGFWSFAGMFSSLKGARGGAAEQVPRLDERKFTEGEVHADLIRNNDGYFFFRYLLVDLPNSRDRNSVRVFVERTPDVRENELVMWWNS